MSDIADVIDRAEINEPLGRTAFSDFPERLYTQANQGNGSLSASEFVSVVMGFLREYVCIGQCNLHIAAAKDPDLKEAIRIYMDDVCFPNLHEMKKILEDGGYMLPAPLDEATLPDQVPAVETNATTDRMISIAHWFDTHGFMVLWNTFAAMSQNTEVRAAFVRAWHRAERWHVAYHQIAVNKGHMMPMPNMDAKGMMRTVMMGG
ncbi:hypothetical protein FG91_01502 [Sphingopyxis sp. LC81]|uniref:hypothetical protein n=1 Tax=unclassified Sphingopyxis TaxID=2614943 RepID=UPI00050FBF84|nr:MULTISPECIES: hypothetical protein [unclassified Sphingopyxis]KGB55092.1 hypothetical protein FG91_01502 [Sphingopyxis sp. LC81]MDT7531274.1 hypothetical protein [Sphingopyxis sp. SE2]